MLCIHSAAISSPGGTLAISKPNDPSVHAIVDILRAPTLHIKPVIVCSFWNLITRPFHAVSKLAFEILNL